jgi:hypothetical protein
MLEVYKSIFNRLNPIEQIILMFWGVCFILFCLFYLRVLVLLIKDKFSNKPQRF